MKDRDIREIKDIGEVKSVRKKKRKKKPNIPFIVCLLVLIGAVAFGAFYWIRQNQRSQVYDELAEVAEPEPEPEPAPEPEPEKPPVQIPVDFAALKAQNPDIYAWIRIADTQVDYPILQSAENEDYYLDHTADHTEGLPGSIYTQYSVNHGNFVDDKVTVIYGHNMKNGSMFGEMKHYIEDDFRNAHPEIQIYTPEHIFTYRVVTAMTYDDRLILGTYDCTGESGYQQLLGSLQTERLMPSWAEEPFGVTTADRMIILSTCNGNPTQRFLIGAVLVNEE